MRGVSKNMIEERKLSGLSFSVDTEDFERMNPQDKKRNIQAILLELLRKNPNGITTAQLEGLTSFDRRTISKHMEYLTAIREAYRIEMGANLIVYYPNGKLMHPSANEDYKIGDKYYRFSFIENPLGKFLYIQEKTKDEYNTFVVKGGLVVQMQNVPEFLEELSKLYHEVCDFESKRK